MKKIMLGWVIVFPVMALLLSIPDLSHSQTPQIIRYSHGFPEQHFMSEQFAVWAKNIGERSKGALKMEIYPMGQLYRDNEVCKAVQMGAIEVGQGYHYTIETALNPTMRIITLPFLFYSANDLMKVARSEVRIRLSEIPEKKGVKLLAWMPWPAQGHGFTLKKPARVPSDLKGLVLRSPDPIYTIAFKQWGIGGSYLPGAEVYMALQQGTLQGAANYLITMVERKLYEPAPYYISLPLAGQFTIPIMNKSFFDKLSPEMQKVIMDTSREMEEKSLEATNRAHERALEFAKTSGKIHLYYPTKSEMDLWSASKEAIWKEALKGDKESEDLVAKIKSVIAQK